MRRRDLFATILVGLATLSVTAYAADAPASAPAPAPNNDAPALKPYKAKKTKPKHYRDPASDTAPAAGK